MNIVSELAGEQTLERPRVSPRHTALIIPVKSRQTVFVSLYIYPNPLTFISFSQLCKHSSHISLYLLSSHFPPFMPPSSVETQVRNKLFKHHHLWRPQQAKGANIFDTPLPLSGVKFLEKQRASIQLQRQNEPAIA